MENIDWGKLPFGYIKTDYNMRSHFKDGVWSKPEKNSSDQIDLHIAATALHYGQEAFEGLKAFRGKDNKIRIFRLQENADRLQSSARGILMQEVPSEIFEEAVLEAVKLNKRFVPPYGSGASLYIRPLLIGTSPKVGVSPSDEFTFLVFVTPVGPYFKGGVNPVPVAVIRGYDRAAPNGTGNIKVGGNYAASMAAGKKAKDNNYASVLYLDSKEKKYIDECGAANFVAIKGDKYITPESNSILPSITNKSLMQLAEELGMTIERRPIKLEEMKDMDEAIMVGTAAVISPILRIDDLDNKVSYNISKNGKTGKWSKKLYDQLLSIQQGDTVDTHEWITIVE